MLEENASTRRGSACISIDEVEEISFTDGKSIHPYPTITIGLSHRADFDGNENVLIQSEKLKMRTTAKILFFASVQIGRSISPMEAIAQYTTW